MNVRNESKFKEQEIKDRAVSHLIPGMDLGTTNSAIAVLGANNNIEVLANKNGNRITPSIVAFVPTGKGEEFEVVVGEEAKKYLVTNPTSTIREVKRIMGRKINDKEVEEFRKSCPYKIVSGPDNLAYIRIGSKDYSPVEISSRIIRKLKEDCEAFLGQTVEKMVITVPANFNDAQRQATKDAGMLAGVVVERIINEPTAAALAYGLNKAGQNIAVFDLGGGTFDISILSLNEGIFEVKATQGNTFLGGSDWDERLVNFQLDLAKQKLGIDFSKDNLALQRFKEEAIRIKHVLSSEESCDINLSFLSFDRTTNLPLHLEGRILRQQFEDMTKDLLEKLIKPCQECLAKAGLKSVDEVVLVGGMTRVPSVKKLVEDFFGKRANQSINPDEAVAYGAAVQGSVLSGHNKDIVLLDVTPLSLGIVTAGRINTILINSATTIPCETKQIFSTYTDNQPSVDIEVIQGESPDADNTEANTVLGRFRLDNIKPAPRGVPQIEVTFMVDANGLLTVKAKDLDSNKEETKVIQNQSRNAAEVERMKRAAKEAEEQDRKHKERTQNFLDAESYCYVNQKKLEEFKQANLQEDPQYKELEEIINNLQKAVNAKDYDSINQQMNLDKVGNKADRLIKELTEKLPKEGAKPEEPAAPAA